jgi:histidinol-phosphate phosphatase family protein
MARAVFLDRDGTINEEVGYLRDPNLVRLLPGDGEAVRLLREAGWRVIVVTNQSAIARGYLDLQTLHAINSRLIAELQRWGATVDDILYCPHHPDDRCRCRKPNTGLIELAKSRFDIDLPASWVIGDQASDIQLGRNAGCRTILVLTGHGEENQNRANNPDLVVRDLREAAQRILRDDGDQCKRL